MALADLSSRDAVLAAMAEYDRLGQDAFLAKYGFGPSRQYVLVHDGKRYDSKAILGAAHGYEFPEQGPLRSEDFSGGTPTTGRLRALGFEVDGTRSVSNGVNGSISRLLEAILDGYGDTRTSEPFGSQSSIWAEFEELGGLLNRSEPVANRQTVKANWSAGRGNWAAVPWIAFLDSRETTTTRRGVYPVLLFRQDLTGVYLTLAQGVTDPKERGGTAQAYAYLRGVAQRVREGCPELADAGFALDGDIDLRSATGLGKDYEASTVAHRLYERGSVPPDEEILQDLEAVLVAQDRHIATKDDSADELTRLVAQFKQERNYPSDSDQNHLAAREELAAALSEENLRSVEADPSRFDILLFGRLAAASYGSPGSQARVHQGLQNGGDEARIRLARGLRHLIYDTDVDEARRIDDLLSGERWQIYGFGEHLVTKALAVCHPDRWLPVFGYAGEKGKKRLSQSSALRIEPLDETQLDRPGQRAVESNRVLRQVLDPVLPDDPWAQMRFLYWLHEREQVEPPPLGLAHLADELLLDATWLEETIELLRHKRQLIFYGPPGTGKTYVARKLAQYVAQDPSRYRVVQFHPSYAYEDFIEGYRPVQARGGNGSVGFELKPGPLLQLAHEALQSEADWCLLIDEINRGNIAKVFGELYYLLEYREDEIELQYGNRFQMPKNLYIIGTMNTADRSIALLDAALRRRFHFVAFFPDQAPIKGLLRRWLERHRPMMVAVADLVDRVNAMLPDRHLQIGPSHFMTPRLSDEWLGKIWRGSVLPYIEEQFFDEPERAEAFRLERLQGHISDSSEEEEATNAGQSPPDLAAGVGTPDGD